MKLQLTYPTKPFVVTQDWGLSRPEVYGRFGFTRHNGTDFRLGQDAKLFACHEGVVTTVGWQPNGAGNYIVFRSENTYQFEGGTYYVESCYMHLEKPLVKSGDKVTAGQLVGIAGNTGFSTGPHTHWRLRALIKKKSRFDVAIKNQADNSIDPVPYLIKPPVFKFTKELGKGMTDPQVKELQKYLNDRGFPVASFGPGAPGWETEYFGERTRVALAVLQATYGITPSGYFGPKTMEFVNQG